MVDTKRCSKCGKTKSRDDFRKHGKQGKCRSTCKKCDYQVVRDRRTNDPGYCKRAYAERKIRDSNYEIKKRLKEQYDLTLEQYDTMFEAQKGVCAICRSPETAKGNHGNIRRLSVDHNHKTGVVRGLLCSKCNAGIGYFDDDPAILAEAIRYLL